MLESSEINIADVIRKHREKKKWTQAKLAAESTIPLRTIQGLESGKAEPRFETIRALALTLGLSTSDLFGETNPSKGLSADVFTSPTLHDVSLILEQLANISPERLAVTLGVLFDDTSLIPESMSDLSHALSELS